MLVKALGTEASESGGSIILDTQSLQFIFPEIALAVFALGALMGGAFTHKKSFLGTFAFLGVLSSVALLPLSFKVGSSLFFGMLVNDALSAFFRQVTLLTTGIIILLSMGYQDLDEEDKGEFYFFLLTVTVSIMLAVSSNNLMMIYITLEAVSVISYIMAGYLKRDIFSSEAGMKYFLFGALSTGVTLYGISLIYGLFGTLDLTAIFNELISGTVYQPALFLALGLVLVGFSFKCSLVPFHMWTPDVYQGAPTPVTAFLSVGPKAMGFAFLLRVFVQNFPPLVSHWSLLAGVIAVLTMTVGNIMALGQNNIKRLLAFSSIAQAGYIFIGLAVTTVIGIKASLFYIFVYVLMNLGAFGSVILISNSIKSDHIEDYAGLYKRDPLTALILTISLLSLSGIPPLAGFLAKFFVLAAAVEAKFLALAIIAGVNSVIALYYYVRVVKYMFLHEPQEIPSTPKSPALQLALTITVVGTVVLGIWPHPLLNWLTSLLH